MKKLLIFTLVALFAISCKGQEKDYKTFYDSGQVEKQGKLDENGNSVGEWKYYHKNG